jgi:hypothetical protein
MTSPMVSGSGPPSMTVCRRLRSGLYAKSSGVGETVRLLPGPPRAHGRLLDRRVGPGGSAAVEYANQAGLMSVDSYEQLRDEDPHHRAASFRRCVRVDGASRAGAGPRGGGRGLARRQARLPVIMKCRVPDHHDGRPCLPAHPRSSRVLWANSPTPHRPPPMPPSLLTCLAQVPDPRRDQGRRHPLAFVLSLAACAVLAGAKSLAAIAEWAADAPPHVLAGLGGPCREPDRGAVAPAEATVRRILRRIDGDALDTAVGSWLAGRERAAGQEENDSDRTLPSLAVDGKRCAVPDAPTALRSTCSPR